MRLPQMDAKRPSWQDQKHFDKQFVKGASSSSLIMSEEQGEEQYGTKTSERREQKAGVESQQLS